MATNNKKKIYKNRNPFIVALTIALSTLAIGALLLLLMFFGFRKYIVYTPDGLHLEIPWLGYGIPDEADQPTGEVPSPNIQDDTPTPTGGAVSPDPDASALPTDGASPTPTDDASPPPDSPSPNGEPTDSPDVGTTPDPETSPDGDVSPTPMGAI